MHGLLSLIILFFLAGCSNEGHEASLAGEVNSTSLTAADAVLAICKDTNNIPASCRIEASGGPYTEVCQVTGYETREYQACGHGILHYRAYLCQQSGMTEALLNQIECAKKQEISGSADLILKICSDLEEPCVVDQAGIMRICYVPDSSLPRREYSCQQPEPSYRNFLCENYATEISEDLLDTVVCYLPSEETPADE